MTEAENYYDIIGVPRDADEKAIRRAYLRASLNCHPDKNPGNEAAAKAQFIKVGEAYNILKDPVSRAAYDRELVAGKCRDRRGKQYGTSSNDAQKEQDFQNFMDMFDTTVAGMSEEELNMAIGAAAVVGSVIGSILGSRAAKSNPLLASAASMIGSAMASRAATSLVKTLHEDSTRRIMEKEERDAATARGEHVPSDNQAERLYKDAIGAVQKMVAAAGCFAEPPSNGTTQNQTRSFHNNNRRSLRFTISKNNGGYSHKYSFG